MLKSKKLFFTILLTICLTVAVFSITGAEDTEEEISAGIVDLMEIMEADPEMDMEKLSEIGSELGYDHLIWGAQLESYEDGETSEVKDILEEDVTEIIESDQEINNVTFELIKHIAPETLSVGIVDLEKIMEKNSNIEMEKLAEIASDLGYDYLVWDAQVEVYEEEKTTEIKDVLEEDITEIVEKSENKKEITDEIIDEL